MTDLQRAVEIILRAKCNVWLKTETYVPARLGVEQGKTQADYWTADKLARYLEDEVRLPGAMGTIRSKGYVSIFVMYEDHTTVLHLRAMLIGGDIVFSRLD